MATSHFRALRTLVAFINSQAAEKSTATVSRYMASIARLHRAAGLDSPTEAEGVKLALKRMRRSNGSRQRQAQAVNRHHVERMLRAAGERLIDVRNKAMLAVAYDTLMRRSELVALEVADVTFAEDGSGTVLVRRSKGDQVGEGAVVYIAPDTVDLVKAWTAAGGVNAGPLFRSIGKGGRVGDSLSDKAVALVFKRMAELAGLDIDPSGHSTRIGAAQDVTAAGLGTAEIQQAGRWKSATMVSRYTENQQARRGASARLAAIQGRV